MGFCRQEQWNGLPFPFPGESSCFRDWIPVSCIGRQILCHWATRKALASASFPHLSHPRSEKPGDFCILCLDSSLDWLGRPRIVEIQEFWLWSEYLDLSEQNYGRTKIAIYIRVKKAGEKKVGGSQVWHHQLIGKVSYSRFSYREPEKHAYG